LCTGDGGAVVAGGDEFLQAELVEVGGEVLEEVAFKRIIAVAVDAFVAEGVGVKFKVGFYLLLNVCVLCVELILLCRPCITERPIRWCRILAAGRWPLAAWFSRV